VRSRVPSGEPSATRERHLFGPCQRLAEQELQRREVLSQSLRANLARLQFLHPLAHQRLVGLLRRPAELRMSASSNGCVVDHDCRGCLLVFGLVLALSEQSIPGRYLRIAGYLGEGGVDALPLPLADQTHHRDRVHAERDEIAVVTSCINRDAEHLRERITQIVWVVSSRMVCSCWGCPAAFPSQFLVETLEQ
jgi:hypothetical protein